ncbi:MAG: type IV pilus secretin PilQ [Thermodesulfobacteriota bacterium]
MTTKQEDAGANAPPEEMQGKLITDIRIADTPESINVSIVGNRSLTYTSVKQPLPLGIVFYFPETSLGIAKTEYQVDNSIIGTIKAAELVENGPSKVTIALKADSPYEITREGEALKIAFKKTADSASAGETSPPTVTVAAASENETPGSNTVAEEAIPANEPPESAEGDGTAVAPAVDQQTSSSAPVAAAIPVTVEGEAGSTGAEASSGNNLRTISASEIQNGIMVSVITDRSVTDYKSFTLSDPPRIVFDLYGVKSPFTKPQVVPVNTQWVKGIRHFGYPERVRMVIDTKNEYLSAFKAESTGNGLAVRLGEDITGESATEPVMAEPKTETVATPAPAVIAMKPPEEYKEKSESPVVTSSGQALVNRIDFISRDQGESSVIIGTTRPVSYDVTKIDEKKIQLELMDAKILSFRQRPLITTRFESAVDRISPIQTGAMKNPLIIIELREGVPYTVNQSDNQIQLDFSASTVAPKPLEEAGLPSWKKMLEQHAEEPSLEAQGTVPSTEEEGASSTIAAIPMPAETDKETTMAPLKDDVAAEVEEESEITEDAALKPKPAKKRYTGEKIALDFYQTDIKNVLRILRDVSGKNFAVDQDVNGKVTLTLVKPVPWDQVLDLILKMNQLGQISEGEIVRIVTLKTLMEEERQKAEALKAEATLKEQKKALEPLYTEYIPISYASASADIKPRLDEIKSPERGKVGVDARNNQIIMTDTAEILAKAKNIVRQIDKVTPQVIIEARIVEVSENFSQSFGTRWDLSGQRTATSNPGAATASEFEVSMNHPSTGSSGSIGANFSRIVGTPFSLNAELEAIEASGDGKIISAPKIVTLDNKEALIKQGLEYPYTERDSSGLATNKFKKIDLELKVTPHVTPDNRISMKMQVTKNDVDDLINGVPSLATNEANTELLVNDGDTIVIGGIIKSSKSDGETRWPILSKIPLFGWLFKSKTTSEKKNELLIFITPRIVQLEHRM